MLGDGGGLSATCELRGRVLAERHPQASHQPVKDNLEGSLTQRIEGT